MIINYKIRELYDKIQKQLFYMIPEKWDKVYLYASVLDHYNNLQTGEMFFYYYPKSMLKKNPVNVYEVPNKFNIDETAYLKLAEKLYEEIKLLRTTLVKIGEKPWSNITISIKDFKFNIEYNYEDLINSEYTSYDRHLIWRYKYLDIPLSSYSKKERKMVEKYLSEEEYHNKNITTYNEGIFKLPVSNIIEYNKQENIIEKQIDEQTQEDNKINRNTVDIDKESDKKLERKENVGIDDLKSAQQESKIKSQILNISTD